MVRDNIIFILSAMGGHLGVPKTLTQCSRGPERIPTIRDTAIVQYMGCTDVTTLNPPESYEMFDFDPPHFHLFIP